MVGGRQMWLICLSLACGSFCWAKSSHLGDYVPRLVESRWRSDRMRQRMDRGMEKVMERVFGLGGGGYRCREMGRRGSRWGLMYGPVWSGGRWCSERQKRKAARWWEDQRVGGCTCVGRRCGEVGRVLFKEAWVISDGGAPDPQWVTTDLRCCHYSTSLINPTSKHTTVLHKVKKPVPRPLLHSHIWVDEVWNGRSTPGPLS